MNIEKKTLRRDIPFLNSTTTPVVDDARRLVVGQAISLNGQISSCDNLVVEGTVQVEGFAGRRLEVAEPGLFSGTAKVQDCVIAGRFEGKLSVTGRLTVKATGQVQGVIEYGALETEAGAKVEGKLSVILPLAEKTVSVVAARPNNVENIFAAKEHAAISEGDTVFRRTVRV